jgi:glycogen debranching enzyme
MIEGVRVPNPVLILHGGGTALACDFTGQLRADELHGFFAGDTRVLSTYRFDINGQTWQLLGRSRSGHGTALWMFQNKMFRDQFGDIEEGTVLFDLRRRVDGALHDDIRLRSFATRRVRARLSLQLDADFADIFEVKAQSIASRMNALRIPTERGVSLIYNHVGFRRGLHVSFFNTKVAPGLASSRVLFEVDIPPNGEWSCCLEAVPEIGTKQVRLSASAHAPEPNPIPRQDVLALRADPLLARPFIRGQQDLHALAVPQATNASPYIAAGAPWFLALFGRDPLVTALMAGIDGVWSSEGALAAVGRYQATERDDFRDAEPGKLPHELREDEYTLNGTLPFSPYYGTHDAPALYCLALWNAWRWGGDQRLIQVHFDTARKALQWCETFGDRDGDGLLEYGTRSRVGYRNQSWKDAEDAVVHADGSHGELPLATVEMQGYLFAALLAMGELYEALGEPHEAERLRSRAVHLQNLVEARFWVEDLQYYAFALDGHKKQVAGIASNPGHLLWCGLASASRAKHVAARVMQPDLFSGWGLRTLSTRNPAYNALSYQRGSVWPHDTLLVAAGLWRYGYRVEASRLIQAVLEAATAFEDDRLPELFCGIKRAEGPPVPYAKANSPQAWAAAAPLLAAQLFVGLVPDAPRGRCYLSPWLPPWLPELEVEGIAVGSARVDVSLQRRDDATVVNKVRANGIEVIQETPEASLWGSPWSRR